MMQILQVYVDFKSTLQTHAGKSIKAVKYLQKFQKSR